MDTKNKIIKSNAVIIREVDYKDYDRLLNLLTENNGILSVYAFNVRRPKSTNIGRTRLFSFGEFELRVVKDKYQLENVKIKKDFTKALSDFNANCYASYFVELAEYFLLEGIDAKNIFLLLYYTFVALEKKNIDYKLIRRIYELKMLKYQGIYKESNKLLDSDETLRYTWDFVLKALPDKLYTFKLSENIFNLFDKEVSIEIRDKVNKKFKSLNFINNIYEETKI